MSSFRVNNNTIQHTHSPTFEELSPNTGRFNYTNQIQPLQYRQSARSGSYALKMRELCTKLESSAKSFLKHIKEATSGTTSRLIKKIEKNSHSHFQFDCEADQLNSNFGPGTAQAIHDIDYFIQTLASKKSSMLNEADREIGKNPLKPLLMSVLKNQIPMHEFTSKLASLSLSVQQSKIYNTPELMRRLETLQQDSANVFAFIDKRMSTLQGHAELHVERLAHEMQSQLPQNLTLLDSQYPVKNHIQQLCKTSSLLFRSGIQG